MAWLMIDPRYPILEEPCFNTTSLFIRHIISYHYPPKKSRLFP